MRKAFLSLVLILAMVFSMGAAVLAEDSNIYTVSVATSDLSLAATDSEGDAVTLKDGGVVDGYHQYTFSGVPGIYTFSAEDTKGSWGTITMNMDAETSDIVLRATTYAVSTKVDGNYLSDDQYHIEVFCPDGITVTPGIVDVADTGQSKNRYLFYTNGNATVYAAAVFPESSELGLQYSQMSRAMSAGTSVNSLTFSMPQAITGTFTVPHGADFRIEAQVVNYKYMELTSFTKEEGETVDTYVYQLPKSNANLTYRCSMEGKITRAGYLTTTKDFEKEIQFSDEAVNVRPGYSAEGGSGYAYIEDSMLLNISDSNYMAMDKGETFQIRPYRTWQIVNNVSSNIQIEPDFHFRVVEGSSVTVDANGKMEAVENGISVVEVTYDAIDVDGCSLYSGIYGAVDPDRKGIFVVNVGGTEHAFETGIELTEFDTVYHTKGMDGSYTFTPPTGAVVEVNGAAVALGEDGTASLTLKDGSNIVKVTLNGEVQYHVIKCKEVNYQIKNTTNPDSDVVKQGDTIEISFDGLSMPVPKMGGVYNPGYLGTACVLYEMADGGSLSSKGVQYNLISSNTITATMWKSGTCVLENGCISLTSMGDPFGAHRTITGSGRGSNFNALERPGQFSILPDITIEVEPDSEVVMPEGFADLSKIVAYHGTSTFVCSFNKTLTATSSKPIADNTVVSFTTAKWKETYEMVTTATSAQPQVSISARYSHGDGDDGGTVKLLSGIKTSLGTGVISKDKLNYIDYVVTPSDASLGDAKTYSMLVYNSDIVKNPGLQDISLTAEEGVTLEEGYGVLTSKDGKGFLLSQRDYTVKIPSDADKITLNWSAINEDTKVKINGSESEGTSSEVMLNYGENKLTLETSAEDGSEIITYTVTVVRDAKDGAPLSDLRAYNAYSFSASTALLQYSTDDYGEDIPHFAADTREYNLADQVDGSSFYLRAKFDASYQTTVSVNGGNAINLTNDSYKSLSLSTGKNQVVITVTPPENSDYGVGTYILNINYLPCFTSMPLTVDGVSLDLEPDFNKSVTQYNAVILSDTDTISINRAYTKSSNTVTVNGQPYEGGFLSCDIDVSKIDQIEVAVSGGSDENALTTTYTIHLSKVDASVLTMNVSPKDAVVKVFDPNGNEVEVGEDGKYIGMFTVADYTYSVMKEGYIPAKGVVPRESAPTVSVDLEKATPIDVTFSAQNQNRYLMPRQTVKPVAGLAELYGYSYGDQVKPADVTTLDALVAAHIAYYGEEFTAKTAENFLDVDSNSGLIRKMFEKESSSLSFAVNGRCPNDGVQVGNGYTAYSVHEAVIEEGDVVEFFFYQDSYWSDQYVWFEQNGEKVESITIPQGESVTLSLRGYPYGYYCYATEEYIDMMTDDIANAQITKVNQNNGRLISINGAVTGNEGDNRGKVTLTFDQAGTYVISAKGTDSYNYIISPWCVVTVTEQGSQVVINLIQELSDEITMDQKADVEAARAAYEDLSDEQKAFIPDDILKKLEQAEDAIASLENASAQAVTEMIRALPASYRITLDDEEAVQSVRAAYEALSDSEKSKVANIARLEEIEGALSNLKIEAVSDAINALPSEITIQDKDRIVQARAAYDSLSEEEKQQISEETLAKLVKAEDTLKALEHQMPFTDVLSGQWFYEDVLYVYEKNIMNGISDTMFGPDESMTRGQFVAVLGRTADVTDSSQKAPATTKFDDVNANEYYAAHVAWAVEKGIINGISEREFAPDDEVTREQIAAMMTRYANAMEISLPAADETVFADDAEIADYAKEAVYRMKSAGILQGEGNNIFHPRGNASRGAAAKMIHLLLEMK